MLREDANSEHWKAKSIDDLSKLFTEKVRRQLRGDNKVIDYKSILMVNWY